MSTENTYCSVDEIELSGRFRSRFVHAVYDNPSREFTYFTYMCIHCEAVAPDLSKSGRGSGAELPAWLPMMSCAPKQYSEDSTECLDHAPRCGYVFGARRSHMPFSTLYVSTPDDTASMQPRRPTDKKKEGRATPLD